MPYTGWGHCRTRPGIAGTPENALISPALPHCEPIPPYKHCKNPPIKTTGVENVNPRISGHLSLWIGIISSCYLFIYLFYLLSGSPHLSELSKAHAKHIPHQSYTNRCLEDSSPPGLLWKSSPCLRGWLQTFLNTSRHQKSFT